MSEIVTVKSVSGGKPWNDLTYYDLVFDRNGADFSCSWGKKSEGAPQVGEQIEGEFYEKKPGEWRFRKASKAPGSGPREASAGTSSGAKGDTWKPRAPRSEYDPEDMARQTRSAAQDRALRFAELQGQKPSLEEIFALAAEFEADVILAGADAKLGQVAKQTQGTPTSESAVASASASPASVSQPADDSHHWFSDQLERGGLDSYPASKLADFILGKLNPKQGQEAERELGDLELRPKGIERLKAAYEAVEGEPVPDAVPSDEDLPF